MTFRNEVFLDTAHVLALGNQNDHWHKVAQRWSQSIVSHDVSLITTDFILMEVGNALSGARSRQSACTLIETIQTSRSIQIVPASRELVAAALTLYNSRPDKEWGLTDCTSFVVMTERSLQNALTVDRHFQQAGFRALLLEDCP